MRNSSTGTVANETVTTNRGSIAINQVSSNQQTNSLQIIPVNESARVQTMEITPAALVPPGDSQQSTSGNSSRSNGAPFAERNLTYSAAAAQEGRAVASQGNGEAALRTFSQDDRRYTRRSTSRGGGTTASRTTSRGGGAAISRTTSRGGQATALRRGTNVNEVNTESLYDSEAQDTEEEDFQIYRSRRTRKKNRAVTGRKVGTGMRLVYQVKKFNLFVTRFEVGVLPETLKSFVNELISDECEVQRLDTRFPSYSSFVVTCDDRHKNLIMNPNEWPEGVLIKKWCGRVRSDANRVSQRPSTATLPPRDD